MKQGDKVVCIKQGQWRHVYSKEVSIGPKYNDVVTLLQSNGKGYWLLVEWPAGGAYDERHFVPLADWEEATAFLESIKKVEQSVMNHSQDAKGYLTGGT